MHTESTKDDTWLTGHLLFLTIIALALFGFFLARLAALTAYGDSTAWTHVLNDFISGMRLDLKTVTTFLIAP
jgi:hypothetical protein